MIRKNNISPATVAANVNGVNLVDTAVMVSLRNEVQVKQPSAVYVYTIQSSDQKNSMIGSECGCRISIRSKKLF